MILKPPKQRHFAFLHKVRNFCACLIFVFYSFMFLLNVPKSSNSIVEKDTLTQQKEVQKKTIALKKL